MATFPDDQEWSVSNTKLDLPLIQEISELQNSPSLGFGGENQLLQLLPIKANDGNKRRRERMLQEDDEFNWTLTSEEAFQGIYSIKSPELTSEGPNIASVTLNIANSNCKGPLLLQFKLKRTCEGCSSPGSLPDYLLIYSGDNPIAIANVTNQDVWEIAGPVPIEDGASEITFEYYYDPLGSLPPTNGTVYLDEVMLLRSTSGSMSSPTVD